MVLGQKKCPKKWTLEKFFPRFGVLVLKSSSLLADFASHGFSFPPKIREKQGLPVFVNDKLLRSELIKNNLIQFKKNKRLREK